VDPIENTTSNNPSVVLIGSCLATAQILLMYLPTGTKQRMFLLAIIHSNSTIRYNIFANHQLQIALDAKVQVQFKKKLWKESFGYLQER
jgi:hypothetical protein